MVQSYKTDQLKKVVDVITGIIQAERIYLLGASTTTAGNVNIFKPDARSSITVSEYQLLIIVPDDERRSEEDLQHIIESAARPLTPITAIIIPFKVFCSWLIKGNLLAHRVVFSDCLVYNNEETTLPVPGDYDLDFLHKKIRKEFEEWNGRAVDFLYGVEGFRATHRLQAAAFMLHQATELCFMAIIRLVTGFRAGTHNLERMMRYAIPFCGPETNIFPRNSEKERRLFKLLQKAYIHARYKDDYIITEKELLIITERVQQLLVIARDLGIEYAEP